MLGLALLAAFAAAVVVAVVLNARYRSSDHFLVRMEQLRKYQSGVPEQIVVANLGTAHGRYAFDYVSQDARGFNFALQSQTLSYDREVLLRYREQLSEGCVVFITVVPLLFAVKEYRGQNNRMYYHFLPKECIHDYRPAIALQERFLPWTSSLAAVKSALLKPAARGRIQCETTEQRIAEADRMERAWKGNFGLDDFEDPAAAAKFEDQFSYNRDQLRQIVDLCAANGWNPIIVIPPFTDIMANRFSDEFMKVFVYDNIAAAASEVPVLDYFRDERFATNYSLFLDSEFLNPDGAKRFTEMVLREIPRRNPRA
ncbi:hypothetical protein [uncultured Adlercreutzia sp.]|uniref:hypothetical protein n=1 Tax=uncultured Adlercreutzia sp. TaxID=875803 RepID=UPI0026F3E5AF|nr:hypothetical protein [uncultured Adlercreutzia sp.]